MCVCGGWWLGVPFFFVPERLSQYPECAGGSQAPTVSSLSQHSTEWGRTPFNTHTNSTGTSLQWTEWPRHELFDSPARSSCWPLSGVAL